MLLALVSAQRAQTLASIKVCDVKIGLDKIDIMITEVIKTSRPGFSNPLISLPKFTERPNLYVFSCLKFYLEKTSPLRKNELFYFYRLENHILE